MFHVKHDCIWLKSILHAIFARRPYPLFGYSSRFPGVLELHRAEAVIPRKGSLPSRTPRLGVEVGIEPIRGTDVGYFNVQFHA